MKYMKLSKQRDKVTEIYEYIDQIYNSYSKYRKSVYSILRQEQRERQPHRKQDMER